MKQQLPETLRFVGASGTWAASRVHFHKPLDAEIATLASLNSFSSMPSPERLKRRRNYLLNRLHESGRITDEQLKPALAEP